MRDVQRALLTAAILWTACVVALTELLSVYKLVSFGSVLAGWLAVTVVSFIIFFFSARHWLRMHGDILYTDEAHHEEVLFAIGTLLHFDIGGLQPTLLALAELLQNLRAAARQRLHMTVSRIMALPATLAGAKPGARWARCAGWLQVALILVLLAGVVAIVMATGVIAFNAPPNNFDSMNSHAARVAHWLQQGSVEHYPTHTADALRYEPLAGYVMLQFNAMAGDDRYANLVQWLSMLGSIIGVSLIARQLGAGLRGQVLASVICATLPMGIMQATSTQIDYVAGFWLLATVATFIQAVVKPALGSTMLAGIALGLALLSKITNFFFVFPLVLWLAYRAARWRRLAWLAQAALIVALALFVNTKQFQRNMTTFGHPLGLNINRLFFTADELRIPGDVRTEDLGGTTLFTVISTNAGVRWLLARCTNNAPGAVDVYVNDRLALPDANWPRAGELPTTNEWRALGLVDIMQGRNDIRVRARGGAQPVAWGLAPIEDKRGE